MGAARSRAAAGRRILQEVAKHRPAEKLLALHSRLADTIGDFAKELAEQEGFPVDEVMIGEIGPALACHGGPGALAAAVVERAD
jgi:fatty acid-binding protein DegV